MDGESGGGRGLCEKYIQIRENEMEARKELISLFIKKN